MNIWDCGEYLNKKLSPDEGQSSKVDASQVVWILTTNAFDGKIREFCDTHESWKRYSAAKATTDEGQKLSDSIEDEVVRPAMARKFSPFFAGRVSSVVTFLPFLAYDPESSNILDCETHVLIN
eukprot:2865022-Amphidinium_carterae.1